MTLINSVHDISESALKEIKDWMDPWFRLRASSSGIRGVTSRDGTVTVAHPRGPVVDLHVPPPPADEGIQFTARGVYGSVNTGDGLEVHTTTGTGQLFDAGLHNITLQGGVNPGHTLGRILISPVVQTVSGDPPTQTEWTVGSVSDSEISGFARLYRLQLGGGNTSFTSGDLDVRDYLGNQVFLIRAAGGATEMIFKDHAGGSLVHAGIAPGAVPAIAFFNAALAPKQVVTGSRGGNAALASLLTALANYGLIIDSTTP